MLGGNAFDRFLSTLGDTLRDAKNDEAEDDAEEEDDAPPADRAAGDEAEEEDDDDDAPDAPKPDAKTEPKPELKPEPKPEAKRRAKDDRQAGRATRSPAPTAAEYELELPEGAQIRFKAGKGDVTVSSHGRSCRLAQKGADYDRQGRELPASAPGSRRPSRTRRHERAATGSRSREAEDAPPQVAFDRRRAPRCGRSSAPSATPVSPRSSRDPGARASVRLPAERTEQERETQADRDADVRPGRSTTEITSKSSPRCRTLTKTTSRSSTSATTRSSSTYPRGSHRGGAPCRPDPRMDVRPRRSPPPASTRSRTSPKTTFAPPRPSSTTTYAQSRSEQTAARTATHAEEADGRNRPDPKARKPRDVRPRSSTTPASPRSSSNATPRAPCAVAAPHPQQRRPRSTPRA